jgi:hypothetical protein
MDAFGLAFLPAQFATGDVVAQDLLIVHSSIFPKRRLIK